MVYTYDNKFLRNAGVCYLSVSSLYKVVDVAITSSCELRTSTSSSSLIVTFAFSQGAIGIYSNRYTFTPCTLTTKPANWSTTCMHAACMYTNQALTASHTCSLSCTYVRMQTWTSTSGLWCTAAKECRTVTPFTSGLGTRADVPSCTATPDPSPASSQTHSLTHHLVKVCTYKMQAYVRLQAYVLSTHTYVSMCVHGRTLSTVRTALL